MDERRRINVRLDREDRDRSRDFAGPGGYGPELEHSDYGFQNYGDYGDYGGADRFTGDWRREVSPHHSDEERLRERNDRTEERDRRPARVVVTEFWAIAGPHSGRGPQGYRKSDERIQDEVCEVLTRHGELDASDIEVHVQDGLVELRGYVDKRQDKYLAEDLAEAVSGGEVRSRIRVRKSSRFEDYEKKIREQREHEHFDRPGGSREPEIYRDDRSWSRGPSPR
jgi:hypothetical protein